MKTHTLWFILLVFLCNPAIAQAPEGMNYQAVARDANGAVLQHHHISLRLTVHDGSSTGSIAYQETDTTTTNQFGLFSIVIGNGEVVQGTFSGINWGSGGKYLEVEYD